MTRYLVSSPLPKIISIFLFWRILLTIFLFVAFKFIPLSHNDRFLGGGINNYQFTPEVFSWANFDGEHYLSIAMFGYKKLQQAFFPVYPFVVSFLARPFSHDYFSFLPFATLAGILISNISFLWALIFLWQLVKIDLSERIAFWTLLVLILFPTSFYFAAVYSESLFLLFTVLSFYNVRKGRWTLASLFGILSSATRVFGIFLLPAFLIEAWQQKVPFSKMWWIFLIPLGLFSYMSYLYLTIRDPIAFYHLQTVVGEQHQSGVIILPQVYFRYMKMFLTVDIKNPIYQTIILEFIVGLAFFILPIYGYFKKIRYSYLVFAMLGFLTPTIQGSFSSLPRYCLVFFPSFIALAFFIDRLPKVFKMIFFLVSASLLMVETTLFLKGYWVA